MQFLHGLITLLAAIFVVIFGGSWALEKYTNLPGIGVLIDEADDVDAHSLYFRNAEIPVAETATLSVPISFVKGPRWGGYNEMSPFVPVYMGPPQHWGIAFNRFSSREGRRTFDGGSCQQPVVNLLGTDNVSNERFPVFNNRVFLPSFAYYEDETKRLLFALIVSSDTSNDGFLSCEDDATLEIISMHDGTRSYIDRVFQPSKLSSIDYDWEAQHFTFVEITQANGEVSQHVVTISLDGEVTVEKENSDILLKAKHAFERTEIE